MGAALGRIAKLSNLVRTGKQFCPNSTEVWKIAIPDGHEKSLWRKQASLEAESHCQDENVAEADMVRRSMSNLRTPINMWPPTVTNEAVRRARINDLFTPCPATRGGSYELSDTGFIGSLQSDELVSSVGHHVKGFERHLSQRINCNASNVGTDCDSLRGRLVDNQCHDQDSETVVVGGVTATQGERESRSQGEGSYITQRDMTLSCGRTGRRNMENIYDKRG
jgi:hypothetical protein